MSKDFMCHNFEAENENIIGDGVAPPSQRRCGLKYLGGIRS